MRAEPPIDKKTLMVTQVVLRLLKAAARGRTGKTFISRYLLHRAQAAGRLLDIADGDFRNGKLHTVFPEGKGGTPRPKDVSVPGLTKWFGERLNDAVAAQRSVFFDLGAGETASAELARDMDLGGFLQATGYRLTNLCFAGPNQLDLQHVFSLLENEQAIPSDVVLFLNEGIATPDVDAQSFFREFSDNDPRARSLKAAGGKIVTIPRLSNAQTLETRDLEVFPLLQSIRNADGSYKVSPLDDFIVRKWADDFERNIAAVGAAEYLP